MLALGVALVVAAEWSRVGHIVGADGRRVRERRKRKAKLRVVKTETDDFAESVLRDLEQIRTIDERDRSK
jgi:hypothetical protein